MSSGSNNQVKLIQCSAFRDHGWEYVAVYPCWPHVLLAKLFNSSHNGVMLMVKELSEIFWRTIRALVNFKYHAPLQRFTLGIASLVLQLLKPLLKRCLVNSLIRKMRIRFLERLIMLNNGFHKRRRRSRHFGSPLIAWKQLNFTLRKHLHLNKWRMLIPNNIP